MHYPLSRSIAFLCFALFFFIAPMPLAAQDGDGAPVYTLADTARARALYEESIPLGNQRKYDEAFEKLDSAKNIYAQVFGEKSYGLGRVWNQTGNLYDAQNRFEEAHEAFTKSLEILKEVRGEESYETMWVYNNLGLNNEKRGDYTTAIQLLEKAVAILNLQDQKKVEDVAKIYNNIGNCYSNVGQHGLAFQYLESALKICKEHPETLFFETLKTYDFLARASNTKGDLKKALAYFETALGLVLQSGKDNKFAILALSNNIGISYADLGEHGKAIEYYENALKLLIELLGDKHFYISSIYNNLGISYKEIQEYEKAIQYHQAAVDLEKQLSEKATIGMGTAYQNMASAYNDSGDYNKAFIFNQKALDVFNEVFKEEGYATATLYNNIGVSYFLTKDYNNAMEYLQKSLEIKLKVLGDKHPEVSHTYLNIAQCQEKLHQPLKAKRNFNRALEVLNYNYPANFERVNAVNSLLKVLPEFASFYRNLFKNSLNRNFLDSSQLFSQQAIEALGFQFPKLSPASKSTLAEKAHYIYTNATATNLLLHQSTDSLHYLTEAFSFAERSKAMLLFEALQETEALQIAGIPDSLLHQEYNLRVDIAYYDTQRQEKLARGGSETDSTVLDITGRLFGLNRSYEELKNRFEQDYPQYFNAKYNLATISVEEARRELLQPGQSMLEYLVGDSAIYIFLLQPEHYEVVEVKRDFPLEEWVQQMTKDGLYGYYTLPRSQQSAKKEAETIRNYTTAARQLYDKLWAPVKDKLTEQVIVIPDGVLGYLPFEALLTDAPPREGVFWTYPYLIHQHQISYCYSATLLREMQQKQHRQAPQGRLLAMAPFFQGDVQALTIHMDTTDFQTSFALRDSLAALPASGGEVAAVAKIWDGAPIYGAEASVALFQQRAPQYRILHLSTHGQADDRRGDYAYLAFGAPGEKGAYDKLYARGLYNLSLNADLVFLSACETGIGKLQRGEGIVSLARAFAYAGAKSIVTTLWKVNDEKARELTIAFYTQLKAGKRKDEALRQAKLSYLEKEKGRGQGAHPFFWAGFIGIGDMENLASD